jgi:O-antigen/teichoic acid export membrane protein
MVLAARLLNLADFADLALASALCAMAVQVADLGVGIQLPRAFAGGTPGVPATAIRQAFLRRLRGSAVAAPLLVAAYVSVGARGSFVVAAGFAVSTVATAMYGAGYVTLRSMGSYGLEAVLEPSGRIVVLVLGVYLATSGYSLGWIAWSYALADALLLGIVAAVVRRKCRGSTGGPPLGRVTWLMGAGPIGMVYWRADIWLLAALATSRQVALYGSSYRLLDAALLPALVISQLFPAPFARCPPGEQLAFVGRWIRGSVVLLLPFTVIAVLFGRTMLTLLFGPHFAGATTALRLLALAAPLTAAAFL